jgi:methionyl-tRNA formyltransferase
VRVALAGQRSFGRAALGAIRDAGHDVAQVFTPLGDRLDFDARRFDIPTSERLVADTLADGLDLIVCAHSHAFVSEKARSRTLLGGIGYHPSLLPRHRGRDAVRWTVHMGDPIAGGSVYWLSNRVDGGGIAATDWVHVKPGALTLTQAASFASLKTRPAPHGSRRGTARPSAAQTCPS